MKLALPILVIAASFPLPSMAQVSDTVPVDSPSAQIDFPASEEKLALIRRFMCATGVQSRIDSGSFLERYAFSADLDWHGSQGEGSERVNLLELFSGPIDALKSAYQKYRPIYQSEYEQHLNWEFTEDELLEMVRFFESPVGQHYLEGTWRMEAYIGTNMEEIEQSLVQEAVQSYRSR